MFKNFKKFIKISISEKTLFVEGFFWACMFLFAVNFLPLKYYYKRFNSRPRKFCKDEEKKRNIILAQKTMRRIRRLSPIKLSCLVRSLTFKMLLYRMGVESFVRLSVLLADDKKLFAHAFVKIDNDTFYIKKKKFFELKI